ncbi:MAG: hypothetical protein IPN53_23955 [Comamonadaceae bacterium]|nr:hypothetical protein [Comamonadaceae bacterium]
MGLEFRKKTALLSDAVGVEDAEKLLEWLQGKPNAKVDLSACTHLHPANIQVLMAAGVSVCAWPRDAALSDWLKPALVDVQ